MLCSSVLGDCTRLDITATVGGMVHYSILFAARRSIFAKLLYN